MDTSSHSNLDYLPEEYIRDGKLSVKLDVYSLGMVSSTSYFKIDIPEPEFLMLKIQLLDSVPAAEYWPLIFLFSHLLLTCYDSADIIQLLFLFLILVGYIRDMYRTEGETGGSKEPVFGKNPL